MHFRTKKTATVSMALLLILPLVSTGCTEGAVKVGPPGLLSPSITTSTTDIRQPSTGISDIQSSTVSASQSGDSYADTRTSRILAWSALVGQILVVLPISAATIYGVYLLCHNIRRYRENQAEAKTKKS